MSIIECLFRQCLDLNPINVIDNFFRGLNL